MARAAGRLSAGEKDDRSAGETRGNAETALRPGEAEGGGSGPIFRPGTKGAALLELLRREGSATLPDLMAASGWRTHSVRGFLAGALKKKRGLIVASDTVEGGVRRYRIAA